MDYLSNFMQECIEKNKSSIPDIIKTAQFRLNEINEEYEKINNLKKEEKILRSLIKQFGGDTKQEHVSFSDLDSSFKSLDSEIQHICHLIIDFFEEQKESNVKDIIEAVSDLEHTKYVLMSLKYLLDNRILSRCESTRKIFKGDLWEEREKSLNIISLKN